MDKLDRFIDSYTIVYDNGIAIEIDSVSAIQLRQLLDAYLPINNMSFIIKNSQHNPIVRYNRELKRLSIARPYLDTLMPDYVVFAT